MPEAREWLEIAQEMQDEQGTVGQGLIDKRLEYAQVEALLTIANELKNLNDTLNKYFAESLDTALKRSR